jgi:hypothetical protein
MGISSMHYIGRRASATAPLASLPLLRSLGSVFGSSRQDLVLNDQRIAQAEQDQARAGYVWAIEALREANRRPAKWMKAGRNQRFWNTPDPARKGCRRYYQAAALRALNAARRRLVAAERGLAAAQAVAATLTDLDSWPLSLVEQHGARLLAA